MTAGHAFRGARGLTLLEIMVAMSIMAVGLLVLLAGFAEGGKARQSAALYTKAILLSEGQMDKTLREEKIEDAPTSGTFDQDARFRWEIKLEPFFLPAQEGADPSLVKEPREYRQVILTTTWPDGKQQRSFELRTLVPAPPK
jgi:prepilin-type N-terminal cleavage/methylation domain-containing protein